MGDQLLRDLHRQSEAAIFLAIDAPTRVVMPEGVQGIFWFAVLADNTGRDLRLFEALMRDVGAMLDLANAGRNTRSSPPSDT